MRISVTTIESYRRYLSGIDNEQKLIDSISKRSPPTENMLRGTAFHSILESPKQYFIEQSNIYSCNDIVFDEEIVNKCIGVIDYSGAFEMSNTKVYLIDGEQITVSGRCDQIIGAKVVENKTKWSTFDIDTYQESCQWRFYIDIYKVHAVKYNVFCMSALVAGIRLNSVEVFEMHPYPNLKTDVEFLLKNFVEYIHFRKLEEFFLNK